MDEFKKSFDAAVDALYERGDQPAKPAHKRLADVQYIGVMYCTSCGDLNLGDRYMTNILKQLLADKAPFDSFAGRVRLIVEEVSMSRGIPEAPEKEDDEK